MISSFSDVTVSLSGASMARSNSQCLSNLMPSLYRMRIFSISVVWILAGRDFVVGGSQTSYVPFPTDNSSSEYELASESL